MIHFYKRRDIEKEINLKIVCHSVYFTWEEKYIGGKETGKIYVEGENIFLLETKIWKFMTNGRKGHGTVRTFSLLNFWAIFEDFLLKNIWYY